MSLLMFKLQENIVPLGPGGPGKPIPGRPESLWIQVSQGTQAVLVGLDYLYIYRTSLCWTLNSPPAPYAFKTTKCMLTIVSCFLFTWTSWQTWISITSWGSTFTFFWHCQSRFTFLSYPFKQTLRWCHVHCKITATLKHAKLQVTAVSCTSSYHINR